MNPDRISIFANDPNGWTEAQNRVVHRTEAPARDPRGLLLPDPGGNGFSAWVPGAECTGVIRSLSGAAADSGWAIRCHASDDPWPVYRGTDAIVHSGAKGLLQRGAQLLHGRRHAQLGVDLPPFYAAGMIPRPAGGAALLVGGIDGKVQIVENGALSRLPARATGAAISRCSTGCGAARRLLRRAPARQPATACALTRFPR